MIKKFLFLLILLFSTPLQAQEVIKNYNVNITVEKSGALFIHEQIKVRAQGINIKRGIYRDFPLVRRTFLGGKVFTNYNVKSVKRDGQNEPFHFQRFENRLRLYTGQGNIFLPVNQDYIYDIQYTVDHGQVFGYSDYDELYWNAIGTQWRFPITKADIRVHFPDGVPIQNYAVYTGRATNKGDNYRVFTKDKNTMVIQNKVPLRAFEGITFAAAVPKNSIQHVLEQSGFFSTLQQHHGAFLMLLALLLTFGMSYSIWKKVGKDPKSRWRAPFYTPPNDISPALAAFIHSKGHVDYKKTLTIAIISLASKGFISVTDHEDGKYTIEPEKDEKRSKNYEMSEDEKYVYKNIKHGIQIKRTDNSELPSIASKHHSDIRNHAKGKYIKFNVGWWFLSLIPMIAIIGLLPLRYNIFKQEDLVLFYPISFSVCVGVMILTKIPFAMRRSKGLLRYLEKPLFVLTFLFLVPLAILIDAANYNSPLSWITIFIGLCAFYLAGVMGPLMQAPTKLGRGVMDHLAGLKLYMSAVEEKILKRFDPPQMSRELYEEYLPYAVALDVESKWGDKFETAMRATTDEKSNRHINTSPRWYSNSSGKDFSSSPFSMAAFAGSFSSTVAAAATPQSSGSGGGGSSGGGGGGGGGVCC